MQNDTTTADPGNPVDTVTGSEEIYQLRLGRLAEWEKSGVDPFGSEFPDTRSGAEIKELFSAGKISPEVKVRTAGRISAYRTMGKSIFADIQDIRGKIQIYTKKDSLGEENFELFKRIDIGDIVGVEGTLFLTRTSEITIKIESFRLLGKSLRTLPEKWHGLTDLEQIYRQRYLDLISNPESRDRFLKRSAIIREIRSFLHDRSFIEVETPMLQYIPGGAAAKPFKTYYEALHTDMFMRIAPELYLKRLLVGGYDKIFELNRNFRNEGMSRKHNPEFTMIEIYQAFGGCSTMMALVEELIVNIADKVLGTRTVKFSDGKEIDLSPPWRRVEYSELIRKFGGADWFETTKEEKIARIRAKGLDIDASAPEFEVTHELYEKLIEATLVKPTFVTKLPAQLVPLAKKCSDNPDFVDVFELEINGQELAPGYSELNNPLEQRKRFEEQTSLHKGKPEEGKIDEDFLTALEYGMPPAGGMGIGIDRLTMLLTGTDSIRDVILFPSLKPVQK